jgi:ketosteroid isomerase-like protein
MRNQLPQEPSRLNEETVPMMETMRALLVCGLAMFFFLSPVHAESGERQAIVESMEAWERAVESEDYDQLDNHYMEHADYYPNNAPPVAGRAAIVERNRQRGAASAVEITQKIDDILIHNDWAAYSCLAKVAVRASVDGSESVRFVRVLLVLQKDSDGQWKILRDIDNATPETF